MRFRTVRRMGNVSVALLAALCCGPIAAQDSIAPDSSGPSGTATAPADETPAAPADETPAEPAVETPAAPADEAAIEPIPDPIGPGQVAIEAASFKEVIPGKTTAEQVQKAWGPPREIQTQGDAIVQLYAVEPFDQIEVTIIEGKVASLVIRLSKVFPAKAVAEQLKLTDVRPVFISNELGEILGQVYPERGVLFAFQPSEQPGQASMKVAEIILEPISAEPFVLRAETILESQQMLSLLDVQQAIQLDPNTARAHWLHGRLMAMAGDYQNAASASKEAVRLEPENPHYRVTRAQILGHLGRFVEAIQETQAALKGSEQRPHVKARALSLLGDLTASGMKPNYRKAIQYHMQAVKMADPLANDPHPAIRVAAKEVLIDAHLGAAHDIAWGNWKEKKKAVTQWLQQANAFVDDLIENEDGNEEHRFRSCTRALAACVGVRGVLDPTAWTDAAIGSGEKLIAAAKDPRRQAQLQWDLGMALYDALQVCQMRSDHQTALTYGEKAVTYLETSSKQQQAPTADYLRGRLYFRLGAIHAIRDENHRAAVEWFEKAIPLLKQPVPDEAFADLARHGETFVSMGVSYWELGHQEKAVGLTEIGARLMERAVELGVLDEKELAVPYSNLASMHRQLGADEPAGEYEGMATRAKDTTLK